MTEIPPEAKRWVTELGLEPLEHEGGLFHQTHLDEHSSAIYYLLISPDFSALHSLDSTEVYHWYAGSPLEILLLHPDGRAEVQVLGPDLAAGQRPQLVVPAGVMQGSAPLNSGSSDAWSLVGTTMSPPFNWNGFKLGDLELLRMQYPKASSQILSLTRPSA